MKRKKTVTPAVRAANLANAQFSTGPTTKQGKSNSSCGALRHGILSRKVVFDNDEQRADLEELQRSCKKDLRPKGMVERFLVQEITMVLWKLGITGALEAQELLRRQELSDDVDSVFHKDLALPISGYDLPIDRGWDCERIVVRAVAGKDTSSSSASRGPAVYQNQVITAVQNFKNNNSQEGGHLEVEAVLGSSLEKMIRYQSTLKRELYRAIETLHKTQAERRERERRTSGQIARRDARHHSRS
jgi:hypothetical protein